MPLPGRTKSGRIRSVDANAVSRTSSRTSGLCRIRRGRAVGKCGAVIASAFQNHSFFKKLLYTPKEQVYIGLMLAEVEPCEWKGTLATHKKFLLQHPHNEALAPH